MVERYSPFSDHLKVQCLEEYQRIEMEYLQKFNHIFNATQHIREGIVNMVRNNTMSIIEQNRQIAHLADLSSHYSWLASYIQTRMLFATADLKDIINDYRERRVNCRALANLLNMTELATVNKHDTRMDQISLITPNTIRFNFSMNVNSQDTFIYRVHTVRIWENLTHTPTLMEYQGSAFVIYNQTSNCIKGIEEPTSRVVHLRCNKQNYIDSKINS